MEINMSHHFFINAHVIQIFNDLQPLQQRLIPASTAVILRHSFHFVAIHRLSMVVPLDHVKVKRMSQNDVSWE